jgi:hypothetical protein
MLFYIDYSNDKKYKSSLIFIWFALLHVLWRFSLFLSLLLGSYGTNNNLSYIDFFKFLNSYNKSNRFYVIFYFINKSDYNLLYNKNLIYFMSRASLLAMIWYSYRAISNRRSVWASLKSYPYCSYKFYKRF